MIELIPAIDLLDGKCVRLEQGDYRLMKIYENDPLEAAKRFESQGFKRLHVVDLDGARSRQVLNWKPLERIVAGTGLVIDFGGGIKTDKDLQIVFNSGAHLAVIGSVAATNRNLFTRWIQSFGENRFILGADVRDGKIAISGWELTTELTISELISQYAIDGIRNVLCTDISKDGMMQGSAMELYRSLSNDFPSLNIIASGGVSSIAELHELDEAGIAGAILGKALYEGKLNAEDLKTFLM